MSARKPLEWRDYVDRLARQTLLQLEQGNPTDALLETARWVACELEGKPDERVEELERRVEELEKRLSKVSMKVGFNPALRKGQE